MKKIILFLIIFSLFFICLELKKNKIETDTIMNYAIVNNNYYEYDIDFSNENLNLENFKLKLATLTSYNYQIKRIYPKYEKKYKEYVNSSEYYIFNSNNLNETINDFRKRYFEKIKEIDFNRDISSITDNYINIKNVRIYTSEEAIDRLKNKYPNVIVNRIEYNK